jgi:hypothetical protein
MRHLGITHARSTTRVHPPTLPGHHPCRCVVEDAPYRLATGHCSHISAVRSPPQHLTLTLGLSLTSTPTPSPTPTLTYPSRCSYPPPPPHQVTFLSSDDLAVSGGGKDRSQMLWRLMAAPPHDPLCPEAAPLPSRAWRPQGRGNAAAWRNNGTQALLLQQRPRELY